MQLFSGGNLRSGVGTCSVSSKQESDKVSNKLVTEDLAARGPDITLRSWWQLKRELKVSVHTE